MTEARAVHVVLHGGLGNQLFQLYKASLLADEGPARQVVLHSELLARYSTARGFELQPFVDRSMPSAPVVAEIGLLCRLRLPKLIDRLTKWQPVLGTPGGARIVDGYFQSPAQYKGHAPGLMQARLQEWRHWLQASGHVQSQQRAQLAHIRLGDFFRSRQEALDYAVARLAEIDDGSDVMSNQESLVEDAIVALKRQHDLQVVPTEMLDSWTLLHTMSGYRRIRTNGSTLAFWAAALAGATLQSSDVQHMALFRTLTD